MVSSTKQILRGILSERGAAGWSSMDEVHPGIYIGGEEAARNVEKLKKLGITHVLNASYSSGSNSNNALGVTTDGDFYSQKGFNCKFLGVPALDFSGFNLSAYFDESAAFIDSALKSNQTVLVHCFMGISRSATLVLAYLMINERMSASEALRRVRSKRNVFPNDGFLEQICDLERRLNSGL